MRRSLFIMIALAVLALPRLGVAAAAGDGLYGTYHDQNGQQGQYFTGNTVTRIDPIIDFDWTTGSPATGIGVDDFTVRWTGEIEIPSYGGPNNACVDFRTYSDDGVRVYINNVLVIDNWTDHAPTYNYGCINLAKNGVYPITIEFYERGGGAVMEFEWELPRGGTNWVIVPQAYLYSLAPIQVTGVSLQKNAANLCGDLQTLEVTFDVPADPATAEDETNYVIPSGPTVSSAVLSGDGLTVTLTLGAPLTNGQSYTLDTSNVLSTANGPLTPDPTTTAFTAIAGTPEPGLEASYFDQNGVDGAFFSGNEVAQTDAQVNFDWGTGAPTSGIPANDFTVRWEGIVDIPANTWIQFYTVSDDGVRLWINDTLIIDNWTDHGSTRDESAQYAVAPGQYSVRLEYYENGGDALIELGWMICQSANWWCNWVGADVDETVPASALSHCPTVGALDHFAISVTPGTASTCASVDVGISARDASNLVITGYAGTIDISTSSGHGDWSGDATVPPQGALANGTADDGDASYAFDPADGGAVELDFTNTHADDLTITVSDALAGVVSTTATISFRDNAFVISATDSLGDEVIAGRPHAMEAAMWRRDPGTGNCSVATAYDGAKTLKAWLTRDSADPGGTPPAADNGTTAVALPNAQPAATNLNLDFTSGIAAFDLLTSDVGKYGIELLDDTRTFATGIDIGGSSSVLTTRPFGLSFRNVTADAGTTPNPAGWAASDAVFTSAGSDIAVTLAGVLWESADDGNDDGIPDNHADTDPGNDANLANNAVTPSFAGDITTGIRAFAPAAGVAGTVDNLNFPASLFSGGSATLPMVRYREVGSVVLEAAHANYLGTAGVGVTGASPAIGRFVPHHFDVTPVVASCGSFTYSGQPFSVSVTALNALGEVTGNYSGTTGWSKVVTLSDASGALAGSFTNGAIAAADFSNGDTCTGGDGDCAGSGTTLIDDVAFTFADVETPESTLALRATDTDGVDSTGFAEGSTDLRSGRTRLVDATGSSISALEQPFLVEHWQGNWDVNTEDVCTAGTVVLGNFGLSNHTGSLGAGETTATAFSFAAGSGELTLSAPGPGNEGTVDVTATVPAWLQFDWNGGGPVDPTATATFQGLFESEEGFIDRREVIP